MDVIHLIAIGKESAKLHLAGFPKFKANLAFFFVPKISNEVEPLAEIGDEMGVPSKKIVVDGGYLDSYRKAGFEAATAFTRGESVGINMSVGPSIIRTAIEDAVRVQLYHFLHHTSTEEISAFKYFVSERDLSVLAVPIWDFVTYLHNDIFDILAATDKPITLRQIHTNLLKVMGREAPSWEAFRKTFREFKRSFRGSPCLVEIVGKGPRYQIKT